MLRTLPEIQKSYWCDHLNKVVHAYNCTRNDTTEFSPSYLAFGRPPRLPVDRMFGQPPKGYSTYPECVKQWRSAMNEAYNLVTANASKTAATCMTRKCVIQFCKMLIKFWSESYLNKTVLKN